MRTKTDDDVTELSTLLLVQARYSSLGMVGLWSWASACSSSTALMNASMCSLRSSCRFFYALLALLHIYTEYSGIALKTHTTQSVQWATRRRQLHPSDG